MAASAVKRRKIVWKNSSGEMKGAIGLLFHLPRKFNPELFGSVTA